VTRTPVYDSWKAAGEPAGWLVPIEMTRRRFADQLIIQHTVDQLRPARGPNSGALPRTSSGAPVIVCKEKIGAIRAFANSRLTSRARRPLQLLWA